MQSGSSGTRCTRKHRQAADVARADRAQLLVGPRQATRCAVHHLAWPGPACVPVGAREVAEADVLRQRAAAGRATRRRAGSAMELRCACGTRVGRWRCHRRPASAAAREMGRDQSRRIEERGAISREDSAASRLSGAHPARSRSSRWGVGVAARSWAALTAPALSKGPTSVPREGFFLVYRSPPPPPPASFLLPYLLTNSKRSSPSNRCHADQQ